MSSSEQLQLLRATVAAKIRYWDALSALEKGLMGEGEFTNKQSESVRDQLDALASGMTDPEDVFVTVEASELQLLRGELGLPTEEPVVA